MVEIQESELVWLTSLVQSPINSVRTLTSCVKIHSTEPLDMVLCKDPIFHYAMIRNTTSTGTLIVSYNASLTASWIGSGGGEPVV